jgi:hypothetical protein
MAGYFIFETFPGWVSPRPFTSHLPDNPAEGRSSGIRFTLARRSFNEEWRGT